MVLHAALAPIQECTDAFRVGTELEIGLWLSAIHVYRLRNRLFDASAFAASDLAPTFQQPAPFSARPNLAFLRSTVAEIDWVEKDENHDTPDRTRTTLRVEAPFPLTVGLRRLQQGSRSIPSAIGQPMATLGFLGASASAAENASRVRVEAILTLDLETLSPTFGSWRPLKERWIEGAVDVSNLSETVVIARLALI